MCYFNKKKSKHLAIFYVIKEYTILMNKSLFWKAFSRLRRKYIIAYYFPQFSLMSYNRLV